MNQILDALRELTHQADIALMHLTGKNISNFYYMKEATRLAQNVIANHDRDKISMANNVRFYRTQIGMTQQKLANTTGLSLKTIHNIDSQKMRPHNVTRHKLMLALNQSGGALFPPVQSE